MALIRRQRAGAIVIDGDRVLVVGLNGSGIRGPRTYEGRWYAFPGGGREEGETIEDAVVRELFEETGLRGVCGPELAHVWTDVYEHHYHLVECDSLELGEVTGPELHEVPAEVGFAAEWLPIAELAEHVVWPRLTADAVAAYAAGAPLASPAVELESAITWPWLRPDEQPPHRATAVIVDAGQLVIGADRTLPGAVVEAGETVQEALARVSRELGLSVRVGSQLALVNWQRSLQSYWWCEVTGGSLAPAGGVWSPLDSLAGAGLKPDWLPELLPGWVADPNPARCDRFLDDD